MAPLESLPSRAPGRPRAGFRRESAGFETELRGYLQARLRLMLGFMAVAGALLLVVSYFVSAYEDAWTLKAIVLPRHLVHQAALVFAVVLYTYLRRRSRPMRTLRAVEVAIQVVVIGTFVGMYALTYDGGHHNMAGFLGAFLVGRALVVPSTVRRTLWLSAPAPLLFLLVQVANGHVYAWRRGLVPTTADYVEWVVWDQAILWLCVLMAAVASRLHFALRVKAWEAKELDQYVIEDKLGAGAMGEVYRARHALMKRPTAIKIIRRDVAGERALQRFEKEVRQTSRLTHPNTIRVYDYGQTAEGVFYYAMELLEGADLDELVEKTGPMPPGRVIHVLQQACGALHEAHQKGLVHRDVKPSNILLCRQGLELDVVKVMDFGLVKDMAAPQDSQLTMAHEVCGSPLTVAPEAVAEGEVTHSVDIYALGAVGYYLLTGEAIFDAKNVWDMLSKHVEAPPIPPSMRVDDVPLDLEEVLLRCLRKHPEQRYATAAEMRKALGRCEDALGWTQDQAQSWWGEHGDLMQADAAAVPASSETVPAP